MSRVLLVTGAASGLGRDVVARFAGQGDRVWATDVDELALSIAAREDDWDPRQVGLGPLDVSQTTHWEAALEAVMERFGTIDVAIHCAAVIQPRWALDLTDAEIDRQIDVNLKGTIRCIRCVGRRMADRGQGHLVLINSLTGIAPSPGMSVYAASKFGARGFALSAAQELSGKGVQLSIVYPDGMETPMGAYESHFEEASLTFSGGRLLTAAEVTDAIEGVLVSKRLETTVPPRRGLLSRAAGLIPTLAARITPLMQRRGRRQQRRRTDTER